MTSKPVTKKRKADTPHSFYNNPSDDLTLVSSDHVLFRVSSWRLSDASSVFEDMLNIPVPIKTRSQDSSPTPINLDYKSSTLEVFLDMISVSKPKLPELDYNPCLALYDFCQVYDCRDLAALAKDRLVAKARELGCAFELFAHASAKDDWTLGRAALMEMDFASVQELYTSPEHFRSACDHLRPDWERVLLRLLLTEQMVSGSIALAIDWKKIAGDFKRPKRKAASNVGRKWGKRSGVDWLDVMSANSGRNHWQPGKRF